jgi:hypothetical protein
MRGYAPAGLSGPGRDDAAMGGGRAQTARDEETRDGKAKRAMNIQLQRRISKCWSTNISVWCGCTERRESQARAGRVICQSCGG